MPRPLIILLLLTPTLLAADEKEPLPDKTRSAVSLLPDGSQLHGVMFPRYDEDLNLVGTLKARAMTLVDTETLFGESVVIEFFNTDGSRRGRADLTTAHFNQAKGILDSRKPVTLRSDSISAKGSGLYYSFERGQGFLTGPATTWIEPTKNTAMNTNHSPVRATAMLGMSLLMLPLSAAPPAPVSTEDAAIIQADAKSLAGTATSEAAKTNATLKTDTQDAAAASEAAREFLAQTGIKSDTTGSTDPATAPLDVKPGPNDTLISCEGGMYFDADEGLFVYLKNVRVNDPRFALSGANELKIFLSKKEEDSSDKSKEDAKPGIGIGAKFGDVDRIVATGAVLITQKQVEKGKQPVQASGAIFTYRPGTGEIVLSGGYPWVKQGTTFMRAKEPNLNLRIQKSGSFITEGNWDMGGNIENR